MPTWLIVICIALASCAAFALIWCTLWLTFELADWWDRRKAR